jgi:hypothetical protein
VTTANTTRRVLAAVLIGAGTIGVGLAAWILLNYFMEDERDSGFWDYLLNAVLFGLPGLVLLIAGRSMGYRRS